MVLVDPSGKPVVSDSLQYEPANLDQAFLLIVQNCGAVVESFSDAFMHGPLSSEVPNGELRGDRMLRSISRLNKALAKLNEFLDGPSDNSRPTG